MAAEVEVVPLRAGDGLGPLAAPWAELETADAVLSADATAAWLEAWIGVYRPARLCGLVVRGEDRVLAAGLVERRVGGRWRFAGAPVSPHRTLVCRPGAEVRAWEAVRRRLHEDGGFAELDVEGTAPEVIADPRAAVVGQPAWTLTLPATLEELLASRSKNSRTQLRKKLRRFDAAGGVVARVQDADLPGALARLVDLHARRAAASGERHAAVDDRMVEHLTRLAAAPDGPRVAVHEARLAGRVAASGVTIDHGPVTEYAQTGLDPDAAGLSPGVCLALGIVRDAMARGAERLDLGPGGARYKRDIGGVETTHWRVVLSGRSLRGRALGAARARAWRRAAIEA